MRRKMKSGSLTLRISPIFAISSVKHSSALATRRISSAFDPSHQAALAVSGSLYSSPFCAPRKALDHLLAISSDMMSRFLHLSPDELTEDAKETQGVRRRIPLKGAERWRGGIWGWGWLIWEIIPSTRFAPAGREGVLVFISVRVRFPGMGV